MEGIECFDLIFLYDHLLTKPNILPSLSEIGDLSCITSCLVLPGFLMDTLLINQKWLCGPETFSVPSRNKPQARV